MNEKTLEILRKREMLTNLIAARWFIGCAANLALVQLVFELVGKDKAVADAVFSTILCATACLGFGFITSVYYRLSEEIKTLEKQNEGPFRKRFSELIPKAKE